MAGKKYLFGCDDTLEIQKLVFGYFLDSYKSRDAVEIENLNRLKHYEFFPGSLTGSRIAQELKGFLQSSRSSKLKDGTQKIIQELVTLIEESLNLSHHIDLLRSNELLLIFLAKTGAGSTIANKKAKIAPEDIELLTDLALKQIKQLQVGQKAVFMMGTITHESLLFLERIDQNRYKLRYFDPADNDTQWHVADDAALLRESFWKNLYALKFSPDLSETKTQIKNQFAHLDKPSPEERDAHARLPLQKKNTCHFRCYLALIKDRFIQESPFKSETAYLEWDTFKKEFGEHLLEKENLKEDQLLYFSQKQQEKRNAKHHRLIDFQSCVSQGKAEETIELYQSLPKKMGPCNYYFRENFSTGNLIKDLSLLEKQLLEFTEGFLISPDDLSPFFEGIENPWVQNSFTLYKQRFCQRQSRFLQSLQKTLLNVSKDKTLSLDSLTQRVSQWFKEPIPESVVGTIIPEQDLQKYLTDFQSHPELLQDLNKKTCFVSVLFQALYAGKFKEVESIYSNLRKQDQRALTCYSGEGMAIFPPQVKECIKEYIMQHLNSDFTRIFAKAICRNALHKKQFTEFFTLFKTLLPFRPDLDRCLSKLDIPKEHFAQVLETLHSIYLELQQDSSDRKIIDALFGQKLFEALEIPLLNLENLALVDAAYAFKLPNFIPFVHSAYAYHLYQRGQFDKIQELPLDQIKISYAAMSKMQFRFTEDNYREGLSLLNEMDDPSFASAILYDLLNCATEHASASMVNQALEAWISNSHGPIPASSKLNLLEREKLLFVAKQLLLNVEKFKRAPILLDIIQELIRHIDSKKSFEQLCLLIESLPSDLLFSFSQDLSRLIPLQYVDSSNRLALAKLARQKECRNYLMNLVGGYCHYNKDMPNNYLSYRKDFLNAWEQLNQDWDHSIFNKFHWQLIKSVFDQDAVDNDFPDVIADLSKHVKTPLSLHLFAALCLLEKGKREKALLLFPNEAKLQELLKKLSLSQTPADAAQSQGQ